MPGFLIRTTDNLLIHFTLYTMEAPASCHVLQQALPFHTVFFHARVSGHEIWTDQPPSFDLPQENVSVYPVPGEVAIGPLSPKRNKIAGLLGIFYGEGRLLDGGNLVGRVVDEDLDLLRQLGERIWKKGGEVLSFETWEPVKLQSSSS